MSQPTPATPAPPRLIQRLPPELVNQIKAGEVIERPASVVKELVENAIDAGATQIDVSITHGGRDLIRVADNGCGIAAEQLVLAVAPHATSKIRSVADLFAISTLGFRGEALASIASVAKLTITSGLPGATAAYAIQSHLGTTGAPQPAPYVRGTVIEVRDLFVSVPARRKFLKADSAEAGAVTEAITRIALATREIGFTYSHNGRRVFRVAPAATDRSRIGSFFGNEYERGLLDLSAEGEGWSAHGLAGPPALTRTTGQHQYLIVNGRYVRDRRVTGAIGSAFREFLMPGRHPVYFIWIEVPPDRIDVNVHPAKIEVRFRDGAEISSGLRRALLDTFAAANLARPVHRPGPAVIPEADTSGIGVFDSASGTPAPPAPGPERPVSDARRALADLFPASQDRVGYRITSGTPLGARPGRGWEPPAPPADEDGINRLLARAGAQPDAAAEAPAADISAPLPFPDFDREAASYGGPARQDSSGPRAFQFLDRYILVEEQGGEAVEVIDQHALHERVIFDRLRAQLAGARLESQRLLFPVPVEVTPSQAEAFAENEEAFRAIGFAVALDNSGDRPAITITAVPRVAIQRDVPEFLRAILDDWDQGEAVLGRTAQEEGSQGSWGGPLASVRDDVLALIACKAACKAGDPLAPEEVAGLLRARGALTNRHNCPHGRPTSVRIANSEFERWFLRK